MKKENEINELRKILNMWKYSAFILFFLLIISIFTDGFTIW
jgi:hypothetical protein